MFYARLWLLPALTILMETERILICFPLKMYVCTPKRCHSAPVQTSGGPVEPDRAWWCTVIHMLLPLSHQVGARGSCRWLRWRPLTWRWRAGHVTPAYPAGGPSPAAPRPRGASLAWGAFSSPARITSTPDRTLSALWRSLTSIRVSVITLYSVTWTEKREFVTLMFVMLTYTISSPDHTSKAL